MSLEGKCCWEKGNSGFRIADMFYLSETFPPAHTISSPPPPPVSQVAGCRCTLLVGNSSVSLAGPAGVRNKYIYSSNLPKCWKWLQKALFTLCCCFGVFFLKISRWVPLTSLLSLTDSDTAIVPRISRELQSTRCFVKIKHCIERIKQYKIDVIIVSKALARVCLLFCIVFSHKRDTRARDEERAFWTKFLQNS